MNPTQTSSSRSLNHENPNMFLGESMYFRRVKREFVLNLLLLMVINLLVKPFFIFGIDLGVQNSIPAAEYGRYFALLFVAYLFQILSDFGVQNFNNRLISQHPGLLPKYFPNLLAIKLLFSVAYLVVTPLAACWVFGYGMADLPLLMVLLVNQTLVQMTLFLRSNVSGLGHYRLDSWLSSLDKFLMLFTCGGLLWAGFFEVSAMHFALAQTLALLLTVLLVFGVLRQKADFPIRPSWHNNWRRGRATLWVLLRKSAPFALVVLLMSAYTRLDGILLERLLPDGPVHAEVFAGAYRLLDAANMFGYLFASLLLPMFARQLKSDPSGQEVRPLVSLSFRLIWAGSISLAAAVFWGRTELMALMMDMEKESAYRADVMGFLIWAFVPVCANYIFGTLLTAHERLAQMNRFFVAGILLDFVLNLLLVPHWKAFGAVVASLCTQTFVAAAMAGLCMQVFGYRISRSSSLRLLGFVILVLVGDFWIFSRSGWPFFGKLLAAGFLSAIALFVFQVIRVKDLKSWSKG